MRVVIDTNVLVSALISPRGTPAAIYDAWREGRFTLLTCSEQLDELRATFRKPAIARLIKPYQAGRLVNALKDVAEVIAPLPRVERSRDPADNFLLALAEAGEADFLVTGDKHGLLSLSRHRTAQIISARSFAAMFPAIRKRNPSQE